MPAVLGVGVEILRWIDIVTRNRGRVGPCATGKPRFDASVAHRSCPMFTRATFGSGPSITAAPTIAQSCARRLNFW